MIPYLSLKSARPFTTISLKQNPAPFRYFFVTIPFNPPVLSGASLVPLPKETRHLVFQYIFPYPVPAMEFLLNLPTTP